MSKNNVPAKFDAEALAMLQKANQEANTGVSSGGGLPTLSINHNVAEAKAGVGSFVIGLKTDDDSGDVVEEGKKVEKLIILGSRNAYSLYHKADPSLSCQSPVFAEYGTEVKGSKYKFTCGKTCPHRAPDANPRCKGQFVLICLAITDEGEEILCQWFGQGSAYEPIMNYMRDRKNFTLEMGGASIPQPIFAHEIILSSTKKKNGSVFYYVPILAKGDFVGGVMDAAGKARFTKIDELHRKAAEHYEAVNARLVKDEAPKVSGPRTPPAAEIPEKTAEGSTNPDDDLEAEILAATGA